MMLVTPNLFAFNLSAAPWYKYQLLPNISSCMMDSLEDKIILFSSSLALGALFISGLQMIKMFIKSKPPGRRMVVHEEINNPSKFFLYKVTADIHLLHASSYQLLIGVFTLANMWRACWGFSSYWLTLGISEAIKISFVLFISVANVSACLQVTIMFNLRYSWFLFFLKV